MPKLRIHFPETLPGAAKFSGDASLHDPVQLVRAFKDAQTISAPLIEAGEALASAQGRPRMPGSWILAAVGFIASRQGDIQPFHDRAPEAFWFACGFERRPSYSTTHTRLTELEELLPEIEEAIARMVTRYVEVEPRIGRHVHIDGTEAETHSRFFHDCEDDEECAWRREGETAEEVNRRVLGVATTESAQRRRQLEDSGEVEDEAEETVLAARRVDSAGDGLPSAGDDGTSSPSQASSRMRPLYRVRTSNHWWLTHDPDAGFRSYRRPNGKLDGWHGYYHFGAIDDFTGLTLFGHVASSSRAEHSQYEEILRGVIRSLNTPDRRGLLENDELTLTEALRGSDARLPEAIIGDRGFGYTFIYEQNTCLGIQTVAPWRKFADGRDRPTERHAHRKRRRSIRRRPGRRHPLQILRRTDQARGASPRKGRKPSAPRQVSPPLATRVAVQQAPERALQTRLAHAHRTAAARRALPRARIPLPVRALSSSSPCAEPEWGEGRAPAPEAARTGVAAVASEPGDDGRLAPRGHQAWLVAGQLPLLEARPRRDRERPASARGSCRQEIRSSAPGAADSRSRPLPPERTGTPAAVTRE